MFGDRTDWLRGERRQLWVFAVVACLITFVGMGEGGFGVLALTVLPLSPVGFLAKALMPRVPYVVAAMPALVFPLVVNLPGSEIEFAMFLPVLAVTMLAAKERNRWVPRSFLAVGAGAVILFSWVGVFDWAWPNWVMGMVLGYVFATLVFVLVGTIEELETTRARMIDQATLVERRKIARDVHDLVGHSLSVVLLHVTGARHLVRRDPAEAERALAQAETAGRDSLAEIRRTVGLMRDENETTAAALPTPGLADIESMVGQYREAGLNVSFRAIGPIDRFDLSDGARAVAGHRIAQEALANVTKHTEDSAVDVVVEVDERRAEVRVVNRGGRRRSSIRPDATGMEGNGLVGMRERAQSAGGSLLVGPTDDGWSVEASFPHDRPDLAEDGRSTTNPAAPAATGGNGG